MRLRAIFACGILLVALAGLCFRLFYLQVIKHDMYRRAAASIATSLKKTGVRRGDIRDVNGQIWAAAFDGHAPKDTGSWSGGLFYTINDGVAAVTLTTGSTPSISSNHVRHVAFGGTLGEFAVATEGDDHIAKQVEHVFMVPETLEELQPLLTVVPLQLLAYHAAVIRGHDVDKPRNLAKSVTVE